MVLHFIQTAGNFISVLTTVHPERAGQLLPIGVLIVYRIWQGKSISEWSDIYMTFIHIHWKCG